MKRIEESEQKLMIISHKFFFFISNKRHFLNPHPTNILLKLPQTSLGVSLLLLYRSPKGIKQSKHNSFPFSSLIMEQQVLDLLRATQSSAAQPRTTAELELKKLYGNSAFPVALVTIGAHKEIQVSDRVAALFSLKKFVNLAWSSSLDEFAGRVLITDQAKVEVRNRLLSIVFDAEVDSRVTSAAANVIAIVAKSDFPEEWPGLLESLLGQISQGSDDQTQAILVVLGELIVGGLDEDQFYHYASALVNALQSIAVDGRRKLMVRAHAVNIFRSCFDFVENLKDKDEANIRVFAKGVCDSWTPFFLSVVKESMPTFPSADDEEHSSSEIATAWRGVVALKIQVALVWQLILVFAKLT
jgi:importin-9